MEEKVLVLLNTLLSQNMCSHAGDELIDDFLRELRISKKNKTNNN